MALSINTNLFALNAQRNLRKTEAPLTTAMQRLSSGLRINSAKDDAAGLAIATRMTRQVNGLTVAMRNANDGVSFAQTAEGAIDEMVTATQRIYELSVQSASYNTSADRQSMNQEVTELIGELNRIVQQTRYNGQQFLNQATSIDIQVGVEVKETINISTASVSPTGMGISTTYSASLGASDVAVAASRIFNSGGLSGTATINGYSLGAAITTGSDYQNNSVNIINRVNTFTGTTGITAFGFGNALVASGAAVGATADTAVAAGYMVLNGATIGAFQTGTAASVAAANIASAVNAQSATTGVSAMVNTDNRVVLSNATGAGISVALDSTKVGSNGAAFVSGFASSVSVAAGQNSMLVLNGGFTAGSVTTDGNATSGVLGFATTSTTINLTATSLNAINVNDVGSANIALLASKQSLETFNSEKAKLGAKLNRLESTIRNIDNVRENITAARSRILDADYATETTNLTKTMIIQQAGISILSQANTVPQQVLALLGQ